MDQNLISLTTASTQLSVSVETLLEWNELNILKPTITVSGQVGYRPEQINQFIAIRDQNSLIRTDTPEPNKYVTPRRSVFSTLSVLAFIISFTLTVTISQLLLFKPSGNLVAEALSPVSDSSVVDEPVLDPEILAHLPNNAQSYSQKGVTDSVFDSRGNINQEAAQTDLLASTILADNILEVDSYNQLNMTPVFIGVFALLLFSIYSFLSKGRVVDNQIILELNQKPDGTISLNFQGREHRISKPELDSESDQFVERLFQLLTPGSKEIDYDSSTDSQLVLGAPLSKLVTRLGFVGLKRDLFFPRTSKNRVLFRRFVTMHDLSTMNLSVDRISSELSSLI